MSNDDDTPKCTSPCIKDKEAFFVKYCSFFDTLTESADHAKPSMTKMLPKVTRKPSKSTKELMSSTLDKNEFSQILGIKRKECQIEKIMKVTVTPLYKHVPLRKILVVGVENLFINRSDDSPVMVHSSKGFIRPSSQSFINIMSCFYDIVVYSTLKMEYIQEIMSVIDENRVIKTVLAKEHCYDLGDGEYVKDLRKITNSMKDIVIVDSSLYSFSANIRNGIYVPPYTGGAMDKSLLDLGEFLMRVYSCNDIRVEITKKQGFTGWVRCFK